MANPFKLEEVCGNTPLIKINEKLYAKLETYNPTGSVKDRMISYVVNRAVENKEIKSGTILCEATSGNSGISLSAMAAAMGLRCVIFMPSNMSEERKQMMKVYGSEIIEAPPSDFETAIRLRDEFLSTNPGSWSPKQFSNPQNVECHLKKTAPEIAIQLCLEKKKWSAFVHGSGTGGTIEGVRRYLQDDKHKSSLAYDEKCTKVCMVIPAEKPHGIQGIGDGRDFLARQEDMDEIMIVSTEEALERAKAFAKETGLLVGISSGANLVASEKLLAANPDMETIVTMLCDRGERYMSLYG